MARIRTIKPQLPQDAKLASASREARLTFIYLLTQADDDGWFRASSRLLLGQLYPHDPDVTETQLVGWLDELRHRGLLAAFDSDEGILGRIVNFMKHQKIDHKSTSYLASLSRKPRERFAMGVLSLGVLSPESTEKAGAELPAPPVLSLETNDEESLYAWYGRALKPILYPTPSPSASTQRTNENRDVSVLKEQLKGRSRQDILDAVTEFRLQAEARQLNPSWHTGPGDNFTLRALVHTENGGIATFDEFRHAAVKRRELGGAA